MEERKPKVPTDLHSKIAYGKAGLRRNGSSTRLVMKLYQQSTSANYGKTEKTKTELSAREKAEAAFKATVTPFEPEVKFTRAIIHPPTK